MTAAQAAVAAAATEEEVVVAAMAAAAAQAAPSGWQPRISTWQQMRLLQPVRPAGPADRVEAEARAVEADAAEAATL